MRAQNIVSTAASALALLGCTKGLGTADAVTTSEAPATSQARAPLDQASEHEGFIRLFEGGCFYPGNGCPTYTATLTPDGRLRLEGMSSVRTPGVSEIDLGADAWRAAAEAIAAADAAGAPPRVAPDTAPPQGPEDAPWCLFHGAGFRVTIADAAGAEREFFWDTACRHAPEAVPALRARLREIVGFETRIKVEG